MKHGSINATLPDKDAVDSVTLREAVALLAAKAGRSPGGRPSKPAPPRKPARKPPAKPATRKRAA